MNFYENELRALKKANRYRERQIRDDSLEDCASNDYLNLAQNRELLSKTTQKIQTLQYHAPMASMLVNGYHQVHADFERALCEANGFEDGVILGSGFNANIALIESLVRKSDVLFIDEKYHASGMLAARQVEGKVITFRHNDAKHLQELLKSNPAKRQIIAVEGIYSMDADLLNREIIELADEVNALLIVDEAHSSGVIGSKLMGIFDYYSIEIKSNYIKMGTLGKAYGSFGAYILASKHIVEFLINRAKPIIYATAPSLFDTLLGHYALEYILESASTLKSEIALRQKMVKEILDIDVEGMIVPIVIADNKKVMQIQVALKKEGVLVGAIRQPTVEKAIIRLIIRLGVRVEVLQRSCEVIKSLR